MVAASFTSESDDEPGVAETELSVMSFYRDDPNAWAEYIFTLMQDINALSLAELSKTTDVDEDTREVVVTGSRIRMPSDAVQVAATNTTNNNTAPVVETREEVSEEEVLQAQLELERREFAETYPDINLDQLLENLQNPESGEIE
jgi:hypothetical protein